MGIASRMNLLGTETAFEVLSRARNLEAQGKQIVHLEIGEPDFDTPSHIVDAGVQALKDGYTHYGPTPGLPQLREAISENSRKVRGLNTDPNSIVVTPGTKPIMFYVLLALSEPGMEVIYPNPGFPIYESMIKFSGAKPVPMQLLEESGYHPDLNDLKNKLNDKTSLIILNSPENPCGSALSAEELDTIADIVKQHPNLYVMADEIYKDILYQGEHSSIAAIEGMQDRTIILDGFSKSYAMTGWRLGYGIMPLELVPHIVKLAVNSVSCAASFSQIAAIAALEGSQEEVLGMAQEFSERKTLIVEGLRSNKGIRCPEPEGAFYVFPNISETGLSSNDFEDRALNEAGGALLAGSAFGEFGEGYVRLSYANSKENIEIAINNLDKFVNSL